MQLLISTKAFRTGNDSSELIGPSPHSNLEKRTPCQAQCFEFLGHAFCKSLSVSYCLQKGRFWPLILGLQRVPCSRDGGEHLNDLNAVPLQLNKAGVPRRMLVQAPNQGRNAWLRFHPCAVVRHVRACIPSFGLLLALICILEEHTSISEPFMGYRLYQQLQWTWLKALWRVMCKPTPTAGFLVGLQTI